MESTQFSTEWQGQGSYESYGWKEGNTVNTDSERMENDQFAPPPIPPPPPSLKRSSVRDALQASQVNPLAIADRRRSVAVVKKTERMREESKEEGIRQEDIDGGTDEGRHEGTEKGADEGREEGVKKEFESISGSSLDEGIDSAAMSPLPARPHNEIESRVSFMEHFLSGSVGEREKQQV